ncbi:hypothetical protein VULLAG_LOCUS5144 [Vulpes lagopus]
MISSPALTTVPVLLFALAEGPQPSPVSHLQDGGGSFNLTSREEFVPLSDEPPRSEVSQGSERRRQNCGGARGHARSCRMP